MKVRIHWINEGQPSAYCFLAAFDDEDSKGTRTLYYYGVKIMSISPAGEKVRYWNGLREDQRGNIGWSRTTGRHIASFCGLNKAEYLSLSLGR